MSWFENIRDIYENVRSLLLYNENETFLFPDNTARFVTLTAGGVANTFGAWAEIVDDAANPFTAVFAAQAGYVSEIMSYIFSVPNEMWIIEIARGAAHTVIGRQRVRSDWSYFLNFMSARVPAGETVYYRAMSESAGATCRASFRYFYV